ncbi:hypothetical protein [Streptomyces sp. CAI-85]|uniref:hypothetical protein n=1 Tax=Streptomyces sp. CAI-85 TaxID=1472662 RepID=UPI0015873537|nr:hypothetical protein [Streptomyces sp. CAI-85]NUV64313.1 hypothetical protein [Streptomyces sp. CAI-85]
MTADPQRVRRALGGLLANVEQDGAIKPDMTADELLGVITGMPDASPVDAAGSLVRLMREAAAALDTLARQVEEAQAGKPGGVRLGIGFTHNTDGSLRWSNGSVADQYRRPIR